MHALNFNERRIATRQSGNTIDPVRVHFEKGEIVAIVHDISVAGIGILTRQRLEAGTWLVLEPSGLALGLRPKLRAEVRHTVELDDGYLVGCCFARLLTVQDVMALG
jgi:PilZ domain